MVKQTLEDTHQVEVFTKYQPAEERLAAGAACDAVLCGLDQPAAAIRVFERTCDCSPGARLILIAGDQNAANQFREQWDAVARRKKRKTTPDLEWLREPCTVSDILALFPPPSEASAKHSEASPTARDEPEAEPHQTSPRSRLAGSVVDGYRLICPLGHTTGQGGSATTWMCVNETTEKLGAMKFVEGKDRMDQELRALRSTFTWHRPGNT